MGAGKVASQCARKMLEHLFMLILCISYLLSIVSLEIFSKLADAATGIYAELMQWYISTDYCEINP